MYARSARDTYNIGGDCEKKNIDVVMEICHLLDELSPSKVVKKHSDLIHFVTDRPGHDYRYAINCEKIKTQLGWQP